MDAMEQLLQLGLGTRFRDLPAAVVERTKAAVLDTLGTAIAGTRAEAVT